MNKEYAKIYKLNSRKKNYSGEETAVLKNLIKI